jgi:hypothetical protein
VEGFGLSPDGAITAADIEYQGVLGRNWLSPWVQGGKYCGSRGMALPLLGLRVRLKGDAADRFDCSYAASFVDGTEVGPVTMGEPCEADSLAPLEAFQILIQPRGAVRAAGKKSAPALKPAVAAKPAQAGRDKATIKPAVKPKGRR